MVSFSPDLRPLSSTLADVRATGLTVKVTSFGEVVHTTSVGVASLASICLVTSIVGETTLLGAVLGDDRHPPKASDTLIARRCQSFIKISRPGSSLFDNTIPPLEARIGKCVKTCHALRFSIAVSRHTLQGNATHPVARLDRRPTLRRTRACSHG